MDREEEEMEYNYGQTVWKTNQECIVHFAGYKINAREKHSNPEDSLTIFTKSVQSMVENEPILHMGDTELNI